MEECKLSLNNFTSIFELIGSYYLLLSISQKFTDFFSLEQLVSGWKSIFLSVEQKDLSGLIKEMEDDTLSVIKKETNFSKITGIFDRHKEKVAELKEIEEEQKKKELSRKKAFERLQFHFPEKDEQNNYVEKITFFNIIKPLYVFTGVAVLAVLIITGLVEKWDYKYINLSIINTLLSISTLFVLINFLVSKSHKVVIQDYYLFAGAVILMTIVVLLWHKALLNVTIIPYTLSNFCYSDFQIIFFVALCFLPILVHIISLLDLFLTCGDLVKDIKKMKKNPITKVDSPELPDVPGLTAEDISELLNT